MSQQHWDSIYQDSEQTKLGWYQKDPSFDVDLITSMDLDKDALIVFAGAGVSTVVDTLLDKGYTNLVLTDISDVALNNLRSRITDPNVKWIHDDLTQPESLVDLSDVDLWYDRAVLHFILDQEGRQNYANLIQQVLSPGGHVVLGQFAIGGASKCSGLDVRQYDADRYQEFLAGDFTIKDTQDYLYINPGGGKRPYTYAVFQKSN